MKEFLVIYAARLLLFLLPVGPSIWTWHMVFVDHGYHQQIKGKSIQSLEAPHLFKHYINSGDKGVLPNRKIEQLSVSIISKRPYFGSLKVSIYSFYSVTYFGRAPPLLV